MLGPRAMTLIPGLLRPGPASALALFLTTAGCGDAPPAGGLWAVETTVEFGAVYEGTVLEHDFALELRSPLAVTKIDSDCGCTVARLEREGHAGAREPYELGATLPAGARLALDVRYDTRGHRGSGPRTLSVATSAGERLRLTLSAEIRPRLVAEPDELEFVRVLEGESAERAFRVRSAELERFDLRPSRRALPEAVEVETRPEDADDSGRAKV